MLVWLDMVIQEQCLKLSRKILLRNRKSGDSSLVPASDSLSKTSTKPRFPSPSTAALRMGWLSSPCETEKLNAVHLARRCMNRGGSLEAAIFEAEGISMQSILLAQVWHHSATNASDDTTTSQSYQQNSSINFHSSTNQRTTSTNVHNGSHQVWYQVGSHRLRRQPRHQGC